MVVVVVLTVPLPSPKNLMEVKVAVVGNRQCGCDFKSQRKITDNMICAGLREGGKDACQVTCWHYVFG